MFKLFYLTLFVASLAVCHGEEFEVSEDDILIPAEALPPRTLVRYRRQLFGGVSSRPFGGFNTNIGYSGSLYSSPTKQATTWGSISSDSFPNKYGSFSTLPATFSSGADFTTKYGSGISGVFSHTDKYGGTGALSGNLNLLNNPSHKWDVFGSQTQKFNDKFGKVGPETTTFGTKYENANGFESMFSKTQIPGQPNIYTYGAGKTFGNAQIGLTGQTAERFGSEVTLSGKAAITDNIHAFGSHSKGLDTKLNVLGSSSTVGAGFSSPSGEIIGSATRSTGQPDQASIKLNVPDWYSDDGKTRITVGSESNFQKGSKPDHTIAASISTEF